MNCNGLGFIHFKTIKNQNFSFYCIKFDNVHFTGNIERGYGETKRKEISIGKRSYTIKK